jgi:hypothetical protein
MKPKELGRFGNLLLVRDLGFESNMGLLKFLSKNKRSIFYALFTGLGLTFALQILKDYGTEKFFYVILLTSLILVFEIYINWRYATKVLRQIDMPNINVYNLWGHLINHISLPLLLFFSLAGFVYFNDDDLVRIVAIFILTIVNLILFINIRSYYEDNFAIEEKTRYVYDLIKLIIFFFGVNLILHIRSFLGLQGLLIYRKDGEGIAAILFTILAAFLISVIFMIFEFLGLLLLGTNVITFLLFYVALAVLHHRIERTLTAEIVGEYVLILILAFLLFWGIS